MALRRRFNRRLVASAAGLMVALAALKLAPPAAVNAQSETPEWHFDWVALTVARNGAWGAASSGSIMRAMVQAIAECRRRSGPGGSGDCGGEITTVRASWSLAYACGDYTFISNGATPADAKLAAIERAVDIKELLGIELPACQLLVSVNSDGKVEITSPRETLAVPNAHGR